ncbi:MAG: Uma2 family endonuclease [Planctomycetes bacterium]|nr:Uma2 family endonuclease [Planctomycetota bacterium]
MSRQTNPDGSIFYPETDGEPMSENTRQFRWILILAGNLAALFRDRADVFVCGNQFWYPVEGEPEIRQAPDVYVVFGRPKGDRSSYKQWEEDGIPMTVVFEVFSPGNSYREMMKKLAFYEEYGVEEYYVYDPDSNSLDGYTRRGDMLIRVRKMNGFVSPRLGIRFDLSGPELVVRYPDGRPFLTMEELDLERRKAEQRAEQAKQEADQAKQEANQAKQRAEHAEQRAARLAELSRKILQQQATPEDVAELERLLQPPSPPAS